MRCFLFLVLLNAAIATTASAQSDSTATRKQDASDLFMSARQSRQLHQGVEPSSKQLAGELTKTPSKIMAEAAQRCIPGSRFITIPAASHGAPWQNTRAFNQALLAFLSAAQSRSLEQ